MGGRHETSDLVGEMNTYIQIIVGEIEAPNSRRYGIYTNSAC